MRMECWIGSELKGARYCSLGGRIAEQLLGRDAGRAQPNPLSDA